MFRLRLLGGLFLDGSAGPVTGRVAQPRRLALLTLLACGRVSWRRDQLIALLSPEVDPAQARHALSQSLHLFRQVLGEQSIVASGDLLCFDPDIVGVDVRDFEAALAAEDLIKADSLYGGPFLDSFRIGSAPRFDEWVESERTRLASRHAEALARLALRAREEGDLVLCAGSWTRLVGLDPFNSRAVVGLMEALSALGDAAGAVGVGRDHDRLLRREMGIGAPTDLTLLIERLGKHEGPDARTARTAHRGHGRPGWTYRRRFTLATLSIAALATAAWALLGELAAPGRSYVVESVAVLPFVNLTGDPERDYFSDGIADELTGILSRVPHLKVPAQSSSFAFRSDSADLQEIAASLCVEAIMHGSFDQVADRVRVSIQLTDADTGERLWAETYDRPLDSHLDLQVEIAHSAISALGIELPPGVSPFRPQTADTLAWRYYAKARRWWRKATQAGTDTALIYFPKALEHDSTYALALAEFAIMYLTATWSGYLPASDSLRLRAWAMADRALSLDSTLAAAWTARGGLMEREGNLQGAEEAYVRAIDENPNYAIAHYAYADILSWTGRKEEAVGEGRKAYEAHPLSPVINMIYGDHLMAVFRIEEAVRHYDYAIDLEPEFPAPYNHKAIALTRLGRREEARQATYEFRGLRGPDGDVAIVLYYIGDHEAALRELQAFTEEYSIQWPVLMSRIYTELGRYDDAIAEQRLGAASRPGDSDVVLQLAYVSARAGDVSRARAIVEDVLSSDREPATLRDAAAIYGILGETDLAFDLLDQAYQGRKQSLIWIKLDPRFETLRRDPRFDELIDRIGLRATEGGA